MKNRLLKSVFSRTKRKMEARKDQLISSAQIVHGYANLYISLNPGQFNIPEMNTFLSAVEAIFGEEFGLVTVAPTKRDVRIHLERSMNGLVSLLEELQHDALSTINSIDWRALFKIPPIPPVDVNVSAPSDDDIGKQTASDDELSKKTDSEEESTIDPVG